MKHLRVLASTVLASIALSGCYTLKDQVDVGLELPEAVRKTNHFIITPGSITETDEWDFLPALVGAIAAGAASGSAQFGIDSLSWSGGPTQYKIPANSPRAEVASVNLYGVFESLLQHALPGAVIDKPQSLPPDRVELVPAVVLRTENSENLYVICTVVATQYTAGKPGWHRPYTVNGGSVPVLKATQTLGAEEFRRHATQCLSDAMRGYRKHISGELRHAYLTGQGFMATVRFSPDRGQRAMFVMDADSNYAYYFDAATGTKGPSRGSVTTVPLRYLHKFERQ